MTYTHWPSVSDVSSSSSMPKPLPSWATLVQDMTAHFHALTVVVLRETNDEPHEDVVQEDGVRKKENDSVIDNSNENEAVSVRHHINEQHQCNINNNNSNNKCLPPGYDNIDFAGLFQHHVRSKKNNDGSVHNPLKQQTSGSASVKSMEAEPETEKTTPAKPIESSPLPPPSSFIISASTTAPSATCPSKCAKATTHQPSRPSSPAVPTPLSTTHVAVASKNVVSATKLAKALSEPIQGASNNRRRTRVRARLRTTSRNVVPCNNNASLSYDKEKHWTRRRAACMPFASSPMSVADDDVDDDEEDDGQQQSGMTLRRLYTVCYFSDTGSTDDSGNDDDDNGVRKQERKQKHATKNSHIASDGNTCCETSKPHDAPRRSMSKDDVGSTSRDVVNRTSTSNTTTTTDGQGSRPVQNNKWSSASLSYVSSDMDYDDDVC